MSTLVSIFIFLRQAHHQTAVACGAEISSPEEKTEIENDNAYEKRMISYAYSFSISFSFCGPPRPSGTPPMEGNLKSDTIYLIYKELTIYN